ncbi:MAG: DUF3048 domain-containing protein [Chloroflexi bacterium]|nr:DUF3048 domain-containing protein [Chloroflexota bacterium]
MKSRKLTISFKKIKILGGLILFAFLLFVGFAVAESGLTAKADTENHAEEIGSPTPFLPGNDEEIVFPDSETQQLETATPRPTVVFEDGIYPTALPAALPTLENISPYSIPEGINPLTGQYPSSTALLERRPIASKIALFPRYIRPMSGLTLSDVVFEYYIEAGLTRFVAVFYGNDANQVGPVRSGRFFDEHIARMYQSYLIFKYADPRVYDYLKSTNIREFLVVPGSTACPPFLIGKSDRDTYNNIFFNTTKFADCLEKKEKDNSPPSLRANYFSAAPPSFKEPILSIYTRYSLDNYHYWGYDPSSQKYYRHQEKNNVRDEGNTPNYAPLRDALTGQHVSADNLVYIFVPHTFENSYQEEDEVYHIDLFGSGEAYLFRDGIVLPAYWQRTETDQPLLITDLNGVPLSLKPGRTFYEVLGESSTYVQKNAQAFFEFETP